MASWITHISTVNNCQCKVNLINKEILRILFNATLSDALFYHFNFLKILLFFTLSLSTYLLSIIIYQYTSTRFILTENKPIIYLFVITDIIQGTSQRGAPILIVDGYRYSRHRVRGPKTRWYCSSHHKKGCKAALHTIGGEIVKKYECHNHSTMYPGPYTMIMTNN